MTTTPELTPAPALLTRREVAPMLRVSEATLCRWAQDGRGPRCIWLTPSAPRYSRTEVEKFMNEGG